MHPDARKPAKARLVGDLAALITSQASAGAENPRADAMQQHSLTGIPIRRGRRTIFMHIRVSATRRLCRWIELIGAMPRSSSHTELWQHHGGTTVGGFDKSPAFGSRPLRRLSLAQLQERADAKQ